MRKPQGSDTVTVFNCGHPRTTENSRPNSGGNGKPYDRCRTCQNNRNAEYRNRTREAPTRPPVVPPRSNGFGVGTLCRTPTPLDLSGDPDVIRYHQEKAKRSDRKRPEIEAAARVWQAQLDAERAARKGGRPKQKFVVGKQRPKELADLLPTFNGASRER